MIWICARRYTRVGARPCWQPRQSALLGYQLALEQTGNTVGKRSEQSHACGGNQNSNWILSGSLKAMTEPIGVCVAGEYVAPSCSSFFSHD